MEVILISKIDFVIREPGNPEFFSSESESEFLRMDKILKDYPYICDAIESENYNLQKNYCTLFDEILFEDKVVGFASFVMIREHFLLRDCFILPEFRKKGLFYEELGKMSLITENFGILQPTRNFVELLIDYSFAEKFNEDIVITAMDFYFEDLDALSTRNIGLDENELVASNFYDLSINSTVFIDNDEVIYHKSLENDLQRYGPRKELDDDYFKNLKKFFKQNEDEFADILFDLTENLPSDKLSYEDIVGSDNELSEGMKGIVEKGFISYEDAQKITKQLIEEYESGKIDDNTIEERMLSLVSENMYNQPKFDTFEEFLDNSEFHDEDDSEARKIFELMEDKGNLASDIFDAVLSDDHEKFERLLTDALEDDDFAENLFDLLEEFGDDDYSQPPAENGFDFNDLGLNLDSKYPIAEMMWGSNDLRYKLDDTWYGKDYPMSNDIYIYRVLDSVNRNHNLQEAFASAEMEGVMTSQFVEQVLDQAEMIDYKVTYDNWNEFAHDSLTVKDLKEILRDNNLPVSGKKQVLIDRIAENQVPLDNFKSENVYLTQNGELFLEENKWIEFYELYLNKFDFNDYVKYLENNDGEMIEVTVDYLVEHLSLAKKQNNREYIKDCEEALNRVSSLDEIP